MAQRMNYYSMGTPDAYGNTNGSMIPSGTIVPSKNLASKKKWEQLNKELSFSQPVGFGTAAQSYTAQAMQQNKSLQEIEKPEEQKYEVDTLGATTDIASSAIGNKNMFLDAEGNTKAFGGDTKKAGAAGAAVGAGIAAAGIAGDTLTKNKKEIGGGIASGAATGAGLGMAFGPWGAAIGAGVGAIAGGISGAVKKNKREKLERENEKQRTEYNAMIQKMKKENLGRAEDLDKYQSILSNVKNQKGYYRKGGILKYDRIDVDKAEKYINNLIIEKKREGGKIENKPLFKLEKGGKLTDKDKKELIGKIASMLSKGVSNEDISKKLGVSVKVISAVKEEMMKRNKSTGPKAPTFKKGGKTKMCKKGCKCTSCSKKGAQPGIALIFRRGGKVDLSKENVIVDGPSHDDFNNTGIKGDRGLPVVMHGKKIAEIESDELVINANSSKRIEELRKLAKKGDTKAIEELGEILMKELGENTYDYSNLTE